MNTKGNIIIHHSAVSRAKNPDQFNAIDQYHKSLGWGHIGYHYCINPAGTVKIGRLDNETGAHCLDNETEILTTNGWKYFRDLSDNEIVATFNSEHEVIEYQQITKKITREWSGELVHIFGKSVDILCTDKHRILYRSLYNLGRVPVFHTKEAGEIFGLSCLLPVASVGVEHENLYSDELLAVAVFAVADGNYSFREGKIHSVRFKLKKDRKIKLLESLLSCGNMRYTKHVYSDGTTNIRLYGDVARSVYGVFPEKKLTWDLLRTSIAQKEIVLDIYSKTDGSNGYGNSYAVFSTEKQNVDVLNALCVETNKRMTVSMVNRTSQFGDKPYYMGSVTHRNIVCLDNANYSMEKYTGQVYCVEVPNSYIVVRRNGKAVIIGNCKESLMNYRSIGICVEGDFDIEQPTQPQVDQCKNLVGRLIKEYGIEPENVSGHRKYATYKSCPGIYFPDSLIKEIALGINGQDLPSDWAKSEWEEMVKLGIMTKNPKAFITKEELAVVIKRLKKYFT